MTVNQFLQYMCYSIYLPNEEYRPYYISKGRWEGMIKWYYLRAVEMQHMKVGEKI